MESLSQQPDAIFRHGFDAAHGLVPKVRQRGIWVTLLEAQKCRPKCRCVTKTCLLNDKKLKRNLTILAKRGAHASTIFVGLETHV